MPTINLDEQAVQAVAMTIQRGAGLYSRSRHLPHLLDIWTLEQVMAAPEPERTTRIVDVLDVLIARQRNLLGGRHWTADANALIALLQAQAAERMGDAA